MGEQDDIDDVVNDPDPMDYQDLVKQVAKRFRKYNLELEDLIQEGNCGLIEFCNRNWDSRHSSARFRSLAGIAISQAIMMSLRRSTYLVSVPWREWKLFKFIEKGKFDVSRLTKSHKEMIADIKDITSKDFLKDNTLVGVNLSDILFYNDDVSLNDTIDKIYDSLNSLDNRKLDVVVSRFGLDGRHVETFRKIGERHGIGKERVRSLLDEAIGELRRRFGVAENSPPQQAVVKKVGDSARRFSGVYYRPQWWKNPWQVMIYVDGKLRNFGVYPTEEEAAEAYDREARKLGRPVNFPRDGEQQAVAGRCGGKTGSRSRKSGVVT